MDPNTVLAAASVYNPEDDNVDYAYAASGSVLHDPTGLSLTLSTGGQKLDEGDDPSNVYAKLGWHTEFWPLGPTGFGIDYTKGENISSEGAEGTSFGIADRADDSAVLRKPKRHGGRLWSRIRAHDRECILVS